MSQTRGKNEKTKEHNIRGKKADKARMPDITEKRTEWTDRTDSRESKEGR